MPRCPHHPEIELEARKRGWYCDECGTNVLTFEHHPAPATAAGQPKVADPPATDPIAAAREWLPTILAVPLGEYVSETNPVLKLWHACDAVELTLRFAVTAGLAEMASRGPLDQGLLAELRPRIEEPTLGKWRGMAHAVVRHLPAERPLLPELRSLVEDVIVALLDGDGERRTAESSLSTLRNQLAHGGGVTRALAARLLAGWHSRLERFVESLAWTASFDLVVRTPDGALGVLRGPAARPYHPAPSLATRLEATSRSGDEILLVRDEQVLTMWPLALFGTPRTSDPDAAPPDELVPQVYVRRGEVQLQLTPLGSETCAVAEGDEVALEGFRALFRLDQAATEAREKEHVVRGFEADLRRDAGKLVGRSEELDTLRRLLRETREGVLWLTGPAGIGKTYLVARIASELLDEAPPDTVVLPYRFKAGDDRCSRDAFLTFALERLQARGDRPDETEQDEKRTPLDRLKDALSSIGETRVLFILDGLDEVAERDALFAREVPLALGGPGVLWLCAGRPERGLVEAFTPESCSHVFPGGVPALGSGDVRTMLLEKIGPLRKRLVAHDREAGEKVTNAFVEKVTTCAQGLPLYVTYVIGDILSNRFRALDAGERLPPSLERYHEELLRRCAVGILHQVVTPLVATLAVAREPLAPETLADLLERGNVIPHDDALTLVRRALGAVGSLVRRATTPEGGEGYTLYHHSLRQHMESSPEMAPALATARRRVCALAASPGGKEHAGAPYLYRHGVEHLLETDEASRALGLLCSFPYLMDRLRALPDPTGVPGIAEDWRNVLGSGVALDRAATLCEAFFREREHLLARGEADWPAYKILLQLATEHADDSPLTVQAEAWLAEGHCDWVWLRNLRRVLDAAPDPCLRVLEGHTSGVGGATTLADGRIISWAGDDIRLWSREGAPLAILKGHSDAVLGARGLADGRILSWSWDNTLRLWSSKGTPLTTLEGHVENVAGAAVLADGRILAWASDELHLWSPEGALLCTFEGHADWVTGAATFADGGILSWSSDGKTLHLWSPEGIPLARLEGHTDNCKGATVLPDGRILSWSEDKTLRLWSREGTPLATLEGHSYWVYGAATFPDGRILSWSGDKTLRLWSPKGTPLVTLEGHTTPVYGAAILAGGRILSWGGHTLRLWSSQGAPLAVLKGHISDLQGAAELKDGRILSWGSDHMLRLWSSEGAPLGTLAGHTYGVDGAMELPDGRILSWSGDETLRLWSSGGESLTTLERHTSDVEGATVLADGRVLSWCGGVGILKDHTLRLWSPDGTPLAKLEGHADWVNGVMVLPDRRILSWSQDGTLCLWSPQGMLFAKLEGHNQRLRGVRVLAGGRLLSWGDDTLRMWSSQGTPLARLKGHTEWVEGTTVLANNTILSWSWDHTLRLWSPDGAPLAKLEGHVDAVQGVIVLADGRIVSWGGPLSKDPTLRLWSPKGAPLAGLEGHTTCIKGVTELADGRILSWDENGKLRLWSPEGAPIVSCDENLASDDLISAKACASGKGHLVQARVPARAYRGAARAGGARWHATAEPTPRAFLADGTVVVSLASFHVFCLKLQFGSRRVSAAEAAVLGERKPDSRR